MKKILISALVVTLGLTACQKPADDTKTQTNTEKPEQITTESATPTQDSTQPDDHADHQDDEQSMQTEHENDDHAHDHAHDTHDHAHGNGEQYQCGDKTVAIDVHDHEGETEAYLTVDDITYDLASDIQTKGRFTTDDSIAGDDKGMTLVMNGNQAKITTLDDKPLLDCIKK